jgi:hypothetical protein
MLLVFAAAAALSFAAAALSFAVGARPNHNLTLFLTCLFCLFLDWSNILNVLVLLLFFLCLFRCMTLYFAFFLCLGAPPCQLDLAFRKNTHTYTLLVLFEPSHYWALLLLCVCASIEFAMSHDALARAHSTRLCRCHVGRWRQYERTQHATRQAHCARKQGKRL